ncbi:MAG: ABC transporter ATP-binding protein [Proteobacteria bacterium]|nr:MAG: ABC transporter ATP-binding protein [Pseudomonadota bacterium]
MITVIGLKKRFKLYAKPVHRLKEILLRRSFHHSYEALKNVTFTVKTGETLGIIGKNGAGKSTLLKILTGVLLPDEGEIDVGGKITGLLELGTGFDFDQTGLQNILSNGLLLGMTVEEIERKREAMIAFSELGEYINEPIRTYSSGMVMRLAFSIAIHAEPKCFVVDEALSVGDGHFQQKCMRKIREFRSGGGSIIFVSHDLNAVKMLCDRALVLDSGEVVCAGSPEEAVNYYNKLMAELDGAEMVVRQQGRQALSYGNGAAEILSASITGEDSLADILSSGETARMRIEFVAHQPLDDITVGIMIRDRFGQDIYGTNSFHLGAPLSAKKDEKLVAGFSFPMDLAPGKYTVTVALHSRENHIEDCYHWNDNLLGFEVAGIRGHLFTGVCRLHPELEIHRIH